MTRASGRDVDKLSTGYQVVYGESLFPIYNYIAATKNDVTIHCKYSGSRLISYPPCTQILCH